MKKWTLCTFLLLVTASLVVACGFDEDEESEAVRTQRIMDTWMRQAEEPDCYEVLTFSADGRLVTSLLRSVGDVFLRCDVSDTPFLQDDYVLNCVENGDTVRRIWTYYDGTLRYDGISYTRMSAEWRLLFDQAVQTTPEGLAYDEGATYAPEGEGGGSRPEGLGGNWAGHGYVLSFFADGRVNLTVENGMMRTVFFGKYRTAGETCRLSFLSRQELRDDFTWSVQTGVQGNGQVTIDGSALKANLQIGGHDFSDCYVKTHF